MKVRLFVKDLPLVHLGIGIFGNATFLVGSVLFLWHHPQIVGVWLFIAGALGMLLGSVGEVIARHERQVMSRSS